MIAKEKRAWSEGYADAKRALTLQRLVAKLREAAMLAARESSK
jgi:hypothetical protein